MSFNLAVMLRETALEAPDKPALIFDGGRMTYAELDEASNRVAAGLREAGIERGDSVGLMLPNIPEFPIVYFAALKVGAVLVPMNVLLKAPEVAYYLEDSDAKLLVAWRDVAGEAVAGAAQLAAPGVAVYVVTPPGDEERPPDTHPFAQLLQAGSEPEIEPMNSDDTAVLLYTSGTTGRPKGAELTHFLLHMCCDTAGRTFGVQDGDITCCVLPLFHVFGLSSVMNTTMRFGGAVRLIARFDPVEVLRVIQEDKVTVFMGVPTMFFALMNHPKAGEFDTSTMRVAVSGGAAIPGEVIKQFESTFSGVVILEGYGLSETGAMATFNRSAEERKVMSIGKPFWGCAARIVNDEGKELPPGPDNIGEIVLRGWNVMKGYYKRPDATAEAFKNGWFHTGDLGYVDEDGFFFIVDRKKELIIRGGYNVYPREVEEVVYAHPAVVEAAVVGTPDPRLGEEVVAVIATAAGSEVDEQEIIAWCKERMAAYKYPRRVIFLPELPKGATGKILKREIVAQLAEQG